jgi:competence protein ComEC
VLIAAPESLTGASFQMSFAAVIALIAAWEAGAGWRRRLHERAELSTHRWLWRLGAGLGASLATTLVASIATGAVAANHFNRLSLLGVVANLLGVPLTGFWIMPWGLLAMLLMPLGLERFALVPMGWGVEGLDVIAYRVAAWPQAATLVPSLPGASLWLLTVGGLWLCLWRRRWRFAGLPVVVAGLLLPPPPTPDLLMSEDGRVLGLRDERGVVHVASARTDASSPTPGRGAAARRAPSAGPSAPTSRRPAWGAAPGSAAGSEGLEGLFQVGQQPCVSKESLPTNLPTHGAALSCSEFSKFLAGPRSPE